MEPVPSSDARIEAVPPPVSAPASAPQDPSLSQSQPQPSSSFVHHQYSSNPNPNPNPSTNLNFSQPPNRLPFNRQQPPPSHFSVIPPPATIAIGVPANASQPHVGRPSMSSSSTIGMIGSHMQSPLPHHRPHASPSPLVRPPHSTSTPPQNFQVHGILRAPTVAVPSTSTPNTSQSPQTSHQPWLSAQHGHPPSLRPQVTSQTLQQRARIPQQSLQPMPASSQPQQMLSSQQQQPHFPASNPSQENSGQQLSSSRIPQPLTNQQISKGQISGNQWPPSPAIGQTSIMHSGPTDNTGSTEALGSCNRILSKRNIQELVNQVDPLENLDPDVEEVLVDIADDFIDSVITFGCSLAKHRKSNTLEAKDILLHLERTWNMTLPGFSGDEIRTYKKPVGNDIHKERLAVIKKSLTGAEVNKSSAGQGAGNIKGILIKPSHNIIGS